MAETLISGSQPRVEDLTAKDRELRLSKLNLTSELLAKECLENLETLQPCACAWIPALSWWSCPWTVPDRSSFIFVLKVFLGMVALRINEWEVLRSETSPLVLIRWSERKAPPQRSSVYTLLVWSSDLLTVCFYFYIHVCVPRICDAFRSQEWYWVPRR